MRNSIKTILWMFLLLLVVAGLSPVYGASKKKLTSSADVTQFEGIVTEVIQLDGEWYMLVDDKVSSIKVPASVTLSNEDGSKAYFSFKDIETMLKGKGVLVKVVRDPKNYEYIAAEIVVLGATRQYELKKRYESGPKTYRMHKDGIPLKK